MFIETLKTLRLHKRESKLGTVHTFRRTYTLYVFRCDACDSVFMRPKSRVSVIRATNDFKHVCGNCDHKKFAQRQGVKMRRVYKMDCSSTYTI
jgi:hypothetical protein